MSTGENRQALLAALEYEARLGSALGVLFSQAVADRVGITPSELETLDLFNLYGPMTPSRLAELTGLTTGGVTRLIDRLERGGFVRREPDPTDRRKVILQPQNLHNEAMVSPYYESLGAGMYEHTSRFSDEELTLILKYMRGATDLMQEEVTRIRARIAEKDTGQAAAG